MLKNETKPFFHCLLEVLTVSPLPTVLNKVPSHGTLEEGLVIGVVKIKLLEGVRLPVGSDVNNGFSILASEDKDTGDNGVVGLAEDADRAEEVFSGSLKTVEETTDLEILSAGFKYLSYT